MSPFAEQFRRGRRHFRGLNGAGLECEQGWQRARAGWVGRRSF